MVSCTFCGKRYLNNTLLGYHLAKKHQSRRVGKRHLLVLVQSNVKNRTKMRCWCGQEFPIFMFGKHLSANGGLDAHIVECLWT